MSVRSSRKPDTQECRGHSERGAVLVEFAFIAMILVVMIAGVFDYGFAWRSGLAVNEAARTGARVGSGQATSAGADYFALNGVRASLMSSGQMGDLRKVVIYKADGADGKVPASCLHASPSGTCNVLTPTQLQNLTVSSFNLTIPADPAQKPTGTGCLNSGAALRRSWCPNARSNNQQTGADYYGVYIEVYYPHKFKLLGQGTTVRRSAVMRLEPTDIG